MMFLATKWEMFYTNSKMQNEDEDLVDQISIDVVNKVFVLYESVSSKIIDGVDMHGNEFYSYYVSREIFDILLQGLKANGYRKAKFEE